MLGNSSLAFSQSQSKTDPARTEIQLSDEQRAALLAQLDKSHSASDVGSPVTIGTALPATVKLSDIPPSLHEMIPAYRGYKFVWIRDDLIIADPASRVVMAVVAGRKG